MTPLDKTQLLSAFLVKLDAQLQRLINAALEAKEFSTNEESKAENKYDTRGLEASYLASGQAQRAEKLREQMYQVKQVTLRSFTKSEGVGMGALIELLVDEKIKKILFMLPVGGVEVDFLGQKIQSITLESPIGSQIHEQKLGYEFEVNGKVYELTGVQ